MANQRGPLVYYARVSGLNVHYMYNRFIMCVILADDVDALQAATRTVKKRRTGPAIRPVTVRVYDYNFVAS